MKLLVLGAGVVGTCTAVHLALRGHDVTLVDRNPPGHETSYGNAGIIQREAVEPYAFPRDWPTLLNVALKRGAKVSYHASALPGLALNLYRYWSNSRPQEHARISRFHARLIEHCLEEHAFLMAMCNAGDLVRREGFRFVYRETATLRGAVVRAERLAREWGVRHAVEDGPAMMKLEPGLRQAVAGAIHWLDPWSINDPGELVARYAALFEKKGGRIVRGDAFTLTPKEFGWQVDTDQGKVDAQQAVVALGPWSDEATRALGYRLPLIAMRGYHRHYRGGRGPVLPILDADRGYMLAPMRQGVRITTGVELARFDAGSTPVQLARAETAARELFDLPTPVEQSPWRGARPCTADMLPVIGPAPKHRGLWFNFGQAQQGFTLGPVCGRLMAEMISNERPLVDPAPYSPSRFAIH